MKQFIKSLFVLGCISNNVCAQDVAPMVLKIEYQFIHIPDKAKNDTLHNENLVLRVADKSSVYGSMPFDMAIVNNNMPVMPPKGAGGNTIVVSGTPMAIVSDNGITTHSLYTNAGSKKMYTVERVGIFEYAVEDSLPAINWQLSSDTKVIGGYTCQQATGTYGGRVFTVWFSNELPVAAGPWKLNGLPGTILEAKDERGEVFFIFKQIKKASEGEQTGYEFRKKPVKVTAKEFKKAKESFDQDPGGIMKAQTGANGNAPVRFPTKDGKFHSGAEAETLITEKLKKEKEFAKNPLEITK